MPRNLYPIMKSSDCQKRVSGCDRKMFHTALGSIDHVSVVLRTVIDPSAELGRFGLTALMVGLTTTRLLFVCPPPKVSMNGRARTGMPAVPRASIVLL